MQLHTTPVTTDGPTTLPHKMKESFTEKREITSPQEPQKLPQLQQKSQQTCNTSQLPTSAPTFKESDIHWQKLPQHGLNHTRTHTVKNVQNIMDAHGLDSLQQSMVSNLLVGSKHTTLPPCTRNSLKSIAIRSSSFAVRIPAKH